MRSEAAKDPLAIDTISVIGLGKLGSSFAAVLAHKGFRVIGVDVDPNKVHLINSRKAPVYEPELQELIASSTGLLSATDDYSFAIARSNVTFIVVPTPSDENGGFSLEHVLYACRAIGQALRQKTKFHLVVLTSTVLPGAMEEEVKPSLERFSGKRCGVEFGLCYNPEFIALGSIIKDLTNPDFVLIGESDSYSGDLLASLYLKICENNPPIVRMNFTNAQLTKIALNSFITMKITFANMIARICERLKGADADTVTQALGLDSRIGPKCLKGAVGYGGPCFPRDNRAFSHFARRLNASVALAEVTDAMNRRQVTELADVIEDYLPKRGKVAILGLSYKPNTNVVEESQGVKLALELVERGMTIFVYDPVALNSARDVLKDRMIYAESLKMCLVESDLVFIATAWEEFLTIKEIYHDIENPPVVLDAWGILEPWDNKNYIRLGKYLERQKENPYVKQG